MKSHLLSPLASLVISDTANVRSPYPVCSLEGGERKPCLLALAGALCSECPACGDDAHV